MSTATRSNGVAVMPLAHDSFALKILATKMRREDREEIRRFDGREPFDHLREQVARSVVAYAGFVNGELLACWGVWPVNLLEGTGRAWCYSTGAVERYRKTYFAGCRAQLAEIQRMCPTLHACVDERYGRALAWLERLGFERVRGLTSPEGYPFVQMEARHAA